MKKIKTNLLIALFCALGFTSQAQLSFGGGVTINLDTRTYIGLLGKAQYQITPKIAAAADFTYWLDNFANFSINVNGYYHIITIGDNIDLSPMAGLNFTSFDFGGGFLTGGNRVAIQIGALFEIPLGGMLLGLEPKIIIDVRSGIVISGFVMFGGGDD